MFIVYFGGKRPLKAPKHGVYKDKQHCLFVCTLMYIKRATIAKRLGIQKEKALFIFGAGLNIKLATIAKRLGIQ